MCRNETLLFRFVEDMDQDEISKAMEMPAGLQDLGNTCYMNVTIQVICALPTYSNESPLNGSASSSKVNISVLENCSGATPGSHQVFRYVGCASS